MYIQLAKGPMEYFTNILKGEEFDSISIGSRIDFLDSISFIRDIPDLKSNDKILMIVWAKAAYTHFNIPIENTVKCIALNIQFVEYINYRKDELCKLAFGEDYMNK